VLRLPRHILTAREVSGAVDREWLDGAFTMYRTDELESFKLDESYFLYFEETDLHTRLRRAGRRVVWVPHARVSQKSSGIPPRLLGRNLFLFHRKLFSKATGRAAVGFELIRAFGRALLTRRARWSALPEIARGWGEGERMPVVPISPEEQQG
jgi:GT2 family glycosyltransferase